MAAANNTTGHANTALGAHTFEDNTTGGYDTALGRDALHSNTTGEQNSAGGYGALYSNTTGQNNTAFGAQALYNLTTGSTNTAVGRDALHDATTGGSNCVLGMNAGDNITTGHNNTLIGYDAGAYITDITTGGYNCCIGNYTRPSGADSNYQYVIGYNLAGKGDSTFMAGGSNGVYHAGNTTVWSTTSDRRIKKNIVDNTQGLDIINQVRVRNFEYRTLDEITDFENLKDKSVAAVDETGTKIGVIAQEIEEVLPDVVITQSTGVKTVNSDPLIWHLINAVKELSVEVNALKAK